MISMTNSRVLALLIVMFVLANGYVYAQRATSPSPNRPARNVQLGSTPQTGRDQVVSVVRRISGVKVLSMLRQNGAPVEPADEDLLLAREATTNITAGFVLGDGLTVAVLMPKPEPEVYTGVPTIVPPAPAVIAAPAVAPPPPAPPIEGISPLAALDDANLIVVNRNGRRLAGTYIGIDGGTGLSLVRIRGMALQGPTDVVESSLKQGQHVKLLSPAQANVTPSGRPSAGTFMVRIGEIDATLKSIVFGATGRLSAVTIEAPKLSPASVGGVVVNDAGQAIGIVESAGRTEARVLPARVVRTAAARILARSAATPRPWLGVRGEALWGGSFGKLEDFGWSPDVATSLLSQPRGILLTSIAPGTPASNAKLLPGDVVVSVNGQDITSNEDLSTLLSLVQADSPMYLNLLRPTEPKPLEITLTPAQVVDPVRATIFAERRAAVAARGGGILSSIGVETFRISEHVASRLGSAGGLFVLSVQLESEAFDSGLRAEDVIETINGEPAVSARSNQISEGTEVTLSVVRELKRFTITVPLTPRRQ